MQPLEAEDIDAPYRLEDVIIALIETRGAHCLFSLAIKTKDA